MARRLPKRGFKNHFSKNFTEVTLAELESFENGAVVTAEALQEIGFISKIIDGIVVLGRGDLTAKNLTVKAARFSASAAEKIANAGGKAEVV